MSRRNSLTVLAFLYLSIGSCSGLGIDSNAQETRAAKLTPELLALYDEYSQYLQKSGTGSFHSKNPTLRLVDDRVLIDATASGDVNALKSDLISAGIRDPVAYGRIISGQLPISAIPLIANLQTLQFARAVTAVTNQPQLPLAPARPAR